MGCIKTLGCSNFTLEYCPAVKDSYWKECNMYESTLVGDYHEAVEAGYNASRETIEELKKQLAEANTRGDYLAISVGKYKAQLAEQFTEHEKVVQLLFETKLQLDEANLNYEACLADVKRYKKMLAEAKNLLKIVSESAIPIILKGDDARILKEIRRFLK